MELKQKDFFLIYGAVALGACFVIFKLVFLPFHEKLADLENNVTLQQARLSKGITLIQNKDLIRKEYDEYASYFSLHDASEEGAKASFLKAIEKIGRDSGLAILDMKPQKEIVKDKFSKKYQINIKADSTMKQLVSFLYALRESSLLFSVDKMVLVPKSGEASDLNVSMTIIGFQFL